jgi:hypothetical protein
MPPRATTSGQVGLPFLQYINQRVISPVSITPPDLVPFLWGCHAGLIWMSPAGVNVGSIWQRGRDFVKL